jgi:hypothetical protein
LINREEAASISTTSRNVVRIRREWDQDTKNLLVKVAELLDVDVARTEQVSLSPHKQIESLFETKIFVLRAKKTGKIK